MAELILELLSEEIPARMQVPMAQQLQQKAEAKLQAAEVFAHKVETYVTPRRLVLLAEGISLTQENAVVEKRGPRTNAPEQAIEGFLRSNGLQKKQLITRDVPGKGEFFFAICEQKSQPMHVLLQTILEELITSLSWPKSMRWGEQEITWVRPLHHICCVFAGEVLPLKCGHLQAGGTSVGHRFLAPEPFDVTTIAAYRDTLKNAYVMLETKQRITEIKQQAESLAQEAGLTIIEDEALLLEIAGLVEWPLVLMGKIDPDYMHIPDEVLIASMRTHQKYICLREPSGKIAPHFLMVANTPTQHQSQAIVQGNERVLRARLADAAFFWELDHKKTLTEHAEKLTHITFHRRLGSLKQKTARIQALAKYISVWVAHAQLEQVERAASLCKADLPTEMVHEFPSLQGKIGYYYALEEGQEEEVAKAIADHYAPLGPSDQVPTEPVSVAVALADKVDSLAGLFAAGDIPTGSKDPLALRRTALGVLRIIVENNLYIPLHLLFAHALKQCPSALFKSPKEKQPEDKKTLLQRGTRTQPAAVSQQLIIFMRDRLKYWLKEQGKRHDLIAAVFADEKEDDLLRITEKLASLEGFMASEAGIDMLTVYRRAANILTIEEKQEKKRYKTNPARHVLEQEEELVLYDALHEAQGSIKKALKEHEYQQAMDRVASLRSAVDGFFEHVTVNCHKQELRTNRLKLLAWLRHLVDSIADFSTIEG